jgi:transposase
LEAQVAAFEHFGGIFARLRYDNLTAAVIAKCSRGDAGSRATHSWRLALATHLFEAVFCRPGLQGAHEKGGVQA